jgi:outer membrane protein OmpA-like peptidoglycan-associated protein
MATKRVRRFRCASAGFLATAALLWSAGAGAQQATFHLDRLEVPGAPEDGLVLFRPVTDQRTIFFAQLGLGYSLNPLHTSNVINDQTTLRASSTAVISSQFTQYMNAGFQLLDRWTIAASLPITWIESGQNPNYPNGLAGGPNTTVVKTGGPAVSDTRVDLRYVAWRSENRKAAVGLQFSLFAPTGNGSNANFGGDGDVSAMPMVTGEYTIKFFTFVANTGVHFRPQNAMNNPDVPSGGLRIGNEWRWAAGVFLPIRGGKFRIGGTIFGQTGLESDTLFSAHNTPIEWNAEGRMRFGKGDQFWAGLGAGTRLANGYGAPDLRIVALAGVYVPILESNATSPDARMKMRREIGMSLKDTDGDGIPDEIDPCPTEPEDHKDPDPNDGCPAPSDRDGDGIPDNMDKCPDQPEDKDGIDDQDGCPEDDADNDGIPDVKDACPKEPGLPNPDPKKNGCPQFIHMEGSEVRVLQQVHFATGSATILPDSFQMLGEIVALLKANPTIKKLMVEGHTDNQGGAAMNLDLSKRRALSVKTFLIQHGIDAGRLDSEGYGLTRPIADNNTNEGRAKNRRVEFKITEEDTGAAPAPPKKPPPTQGGDSKDR